MVDILKGIFYAQFDNALGPRIAFQYPEKYVFIRDPRYQRQFLG